MPEILFVGVRHFLFRQGRATWSLAKYGRFVDSAGGFERLVPVVEAARAVADKHGVSVANVACRWVLQQRAVGAVIVGASPLTPPPLVKLHRATLGQSQLHRPTSSYPLRA